MTIDLVKQDEHIAHTSHRDAPSKCPQCGALQSGDSPVCDTCGRSMAGEEPRSKWDRATWAVVVALLCAGPLALPWVWFHPRYSHRTKWLVSLGVMLLTVGLCALLILTIWLVLVQIRTLLTF